MFFIPILFKSGASQFQIVQDLGIITSDNFSLSSDLSNIETVYKQDIIDNFNFSFENLEIIQIISEGLSFLDDYSLNLHEFIIDYLFKLSYSQITSIALEDFLSARFLPDYHTIEYLANESQLDRYSVSKVLVALSNLLRDCQEYDVRQINAISLRIHKAIMNNNKTVFVITEY
jgi:hypothetical protein